MYIYYILLYILYIQLSFQKQSSTEILMGECSGSKPRICGVPSMPKCNFNKNAMQFCWDHTLALVFCEFGTSL